MIAFIRKILQVLTPSERAKLGVLTGLDILVSIADIVFLVLLLYIVQFYTGSISPGKLFFLPAVLSDPHSLWPIGVVFLLFCAKNAVSFRVYQAQCRFRFGVALRISENNLLSYLEGSYHEYVNTDSSVHAGYISQQPLEFSQNILEAFQQCISETTLVSVSVVAVLLYNAKLFLLLLALLLPPVIIMAWLIRRKQHSAKLQIKTGREIMWQHVHEAIAGFVESNLYDKKLFFANRYARSQAALSADLAVLRSLQGAPSRVAEIFAVFGLLGLIGLNHFSATGHGSPFVTLGAFLAAAYKIIPGVARILNIGGQMRTFSFTVDGLVRREASAKIIPIGSAVASSDGRSSGIHSLACRGIDFQYGHHPVLKGFCLSVRRGDFLGIHGGSGKGKTTILHILLGLLEPGTGEILFNDIPCNAPQIRRYWRQIAYVKQQPFIINDTVLANIVLDEGDYDPGRLQSALSVSGLDEFVERLPDGIHNRITENGKNISGGQRQRIAIARALYKGGDLILLDEPFSELDEASEERLLAHFGQMALEGKGVILITHNKKSLSSCNKTLTLDQRYNPLAG
ncbi:MAG: ATP-binding cassette domain-containing protein [Puia sp.]|nr:ATP-binding cassette domain-containing protein [Puia sp.]